MPLYEYYCTACEARFSRNESMAEHSRGGGGPSRPTCPHCDSPAVVPVFSNFFAKTVRKS